MTDCEVASEKLPPTENDLPLVPTLFLYFYPSRRTSPRYVRAAKLYVERRSFGKLAPKDREWLMRLMDVLKEYPLTREIERKGWKQLAKHLKKPQKVTDDLIKQIRHSMMLCAFASEKVKDVETLLKRRRGSYVFAGVYSLIPDAS